MLDDALVKLPPQSALVFRHYHLPEIERRRRFDGLVAIARSHGHLVILAGDAQQAAAWGADGLYGIAGIVATAGNGMLRIATAHDRGELDAAHTAGADATMLSPIFPTASHPGGAVLEPDGFHDLAAQAKMPVIALGGMTADRAATLGWKRWAAIDGLSLRAD